eukprot:PhM_4_TR17584/c0_g1_i1/m.94002
MSAHSQLAKELSAAELRARLDANIGTSLNPSQPLPSEVEGLIMGLLRPTWPNLSVHLSASKSVCGKSWSKATMGYKCVTCEKDPTCIICIECFKAGDHTGHDYKLIRTSGGMCDCGDPDAWDSKGFCSAHRGISEDVDACADIPPADRELMETMAGFSAQTIIKCLRAMASMSEVSPLHRNVGFLMSGLMMMAKAGDAGRRLVAQVICEGKDAILEDIFNFDTPDETTPPWDNALSLVHDLLYTLMPDPWFKFRFARMLIHKYPLLLLKKCNPNSATARGARARDEDRFLVHLAVQVLTVPSIAQRLLLDTNLAAGPGVTMLHIMLEGLLTSLAHMSRAVAPSTAFLADGSTPLAALTFAPTQSHLQLELLRILYDVGYVLTSHVDVGIALATNSLYLRAVLLYATAVQNSCFVYRRDEDFTTFQETTHMELSMGTMKRRLRDAIRVLPVTHKASDDCAGKYPRLAREKISKANVREMLDAYLNNAEYKPSSLPSIPSILTVVAEYIECSAEHHQSTLTTMPKLPIFHFDCYRNPRHGVTFSLPLYRIFATIVADVCSSPAGRKESDISVFLPSGLCSQPLRLLRAADIVVAPQVLRGQVAANMWRRDHMNVNAQVHFYETIVPHATMVEDLFFLQVAACIVGPTALIPLLCTRFLSWHPHHGVGMLDLLHLIIVLATNRWGARTARENACQHLKNVLAHGQRTHSELSENLRALRVENDDDEDGAEADVIPEVADKKPNAKPAAFVLKPHLWETISYYECELSSRDADMIHKAWEETSAAKSKKPTPLFLPDTHAPMLREGPLAPSILMLHHRDTHHVAIAAIAASVAKMEPDHALRAALDVLILALRTLDLRDALLAKTDLCVISNMKAAEVVFEEHAAPTLLRAKFKTHDVVENLRVVVPQTPEYAAEQAPLNTNAIAMVVLMQKNGGGAFNDYARRFEELLSLVGVAAPHVMRETHEHMAAAACEEDATNDNDKNENSEKKSNARKLSAQDRQAKLMAKMRQQQSSMMAHMDDNDDEASESARGHHNHSVAETLTKLLEADKCVFCHVDGDRSTLGLIFTTSCSSVMRTLNKHKIPTVAATSSQVSEPEDEVALWDDAFPFEFASASVPHNSSIHIHACGHQAHSTCLEKHKDFLQQSRRQQESFRGDHYLDEVHFLCPLCSRMGISILPTVNSAAPIVAPSSDTNPSVKDTLDLVLGDDGARLPPSWVGPSDPQRLSIAETGLLLCHMSIRSQEERDEDDYTSSDNDYANAARVLVSQIALLELQTRFPSSSGKLPVRTIAVLRLLAQNALYHLHHGPEETRNEINAVAKRIRAMLRGEYHAEDGDGDPPLLSCDLFTIFSQTLFYIALRDGRFNYSHYRNLLAYFLTWAHRQREGNVHDVLPFLRQAAVLHTVLFAESVMISHDAVASMTLNAALNDVVPTDTDSTAVLCRFLFGVEESVESCVVRPFNSIPYADSIMTAADGSSTKPHGAVVDSGDGLLPYLSSMPNDYLELLNARCEEHCKSCNRKPTEAVVCLCCGELMCLGANCCPREASMHATLCGGGLSLFIMLRKSTVLIVDAVTSVCGVLESFYLDEHGETDVGLRRGRPLYKCEESVQELHELWRTGAFCHDTKTLSKLVWLPPTI